MSSATVLEFRRRPPAPDLSPLVKDGQQLVVTLATFARRCAEHLEAAATTLPPALDAQVALEVSGAAAVDTVLHDLADALRPALDAVLDVESAMYARQQLEARS